MAAEGKRPVHARPHSDEARRKIREARARQGAPWNKGKKGPSPWNKGLTKETSAAVAALGKKVGDAQHGKKRGPLSEAVKRKLAEGRTGDKNWAKKPEVKAKIRDSLLKTYEKRPEILANRKPSGLNQHSGRFSSLERTVAAELDRLGIPYLHNAKVGRYWADFIVFGKVVLECDGGYWHRDGEKERRRDAYLAGEGYAVFHLTESEITGNAARAVEQALHVHAAGFEE